MSFQLEPFQTIGLDEALLSVLIDEHETVTLPRLTRLWSYFRNALGEPDDLGATHSAPAQSIGLPRRLLDPRRARNDDRFEREIVIENDIGWRIHTLVDFMFPTAPKIVSLARTDESRSVIEAILQAVLEGNGAAAMWQNAALLGSVYGSVDFLVHADALATLGRSTFASTHAVAESSGEAPSNHAVENLATRIGSSVRIETVEAPRAIPLLNRADYRIIDAYVIHYEQLTNDVTQDGMLARLSRAISPRFGARPRRATTQVTEVYSAARFQRYEDGELVAETVNRLGRLPVIHVQNLSQPLFYEGLSDVEPLIPLQDELNTRLSDRANRVTMQSFQMWLGKGIEGFANRPIGPGQMWVTDNLDASIEAFGGDADSPSEAAHIEELREAIDKASGVTPAAAGHIKAKIGNLTSENALRISLMGTIAKIKRKRITYGAGIEQLCELILHALDVFGVYRTDPADRRVRLVWSDPLPGDESRRIDDALAKAQLGVPGDTLRAELGYPDDEPVAAATAGSSVIA